MRTSPRAPLSLLAMALLPVLAGCRQPAEPPPAAPSNAPAQASPASTQAPKTKVIAYINVSSGCQAATVDLLNSLGMDYHDKVDLEIVDFGSPEGEERWRSDGLDCLTLLFNGSPAVKFPGADGVTRTVTFFMPAGLGWTHDDLKDVFAAIGAGTLQVLSEEQAQSELAPRPVKLKVTTRPVSGGTEVLINGTPAVTVKAGAEGQTPAQRAQALRAGLETWAASPLHPSELTVATAAGATILMAGSTKLATVTDADAKAAGQPQLRGVAIEWLNGLKKPVIAAMPPAAPAQTPKP
jgi:hypothetical protein